MARILGADMFLGIVKLMLEFMLGYGKRIKVQAPVLAHCAQKVSRCIVSDTNGV